MLLCFTECALACALVGLPMAPQDSATIGLCTSPLEEYGSTAGFSHTQFTCKMHLPRVTLQPQSHYISGGDGRIYATAEGFRGLVPLLPPLSVPEVWVCGVYSESPRKGFSEMYGLGGCPEPYFFENWPLPLTVWVFFAFSGECHACSAHAVQSFECWPILRPYFWPLLISFWFHAGVFLASYAFGMWHI